MQPCAQSAAFPRQAPGELSAACVGNEHPRAVSAVNLVRCCAMPCSAQATQGVCGMPDAVEADDLGKHTAGHTLLAALWQRLSPVLETYCQDQGMDPAVSVEGVLEGLGQVLARREPSSAQWKDLEASACRYKDFVSSGQDAQLSFHQDARQVTGLPGFCGEPQPADTCILDT